jgi:hypothetical protein
MITFIVKKNKMPHLSVPPILIDGLGRKKDKKEKVYFFAENVRKSTKIAIQTCVESCT